MNREFLRGVCAGALAGAAVELMLYGCEYSTHTRMGNTMRSMGDTVDDMAGHFSRKFH